MRKKKPKPLRNFECEIYHIEETFTKGLKIEITETEDCGRKRKHIISLTKLLSADDVKGYTLVEQEIYLMNSAGIYANMDYNSWEIKGPCQTDRTLATFRNLLYDNGYEELGDSFFKGGSYKDLIAWD